MTGGETKAKNFDILHFVADNAGLSTFEAIEKAYNIGASEQKSILDKIRAEIEQLPTNYIEVQRPHSTVERYVVELDAVLRVLDKYKAEK